jgi:hypothetical protein
MGYGRTSYRRGYRSASMTAGRVARVNARPGDCLNCGEEIPAGAGHLWRQADGSWSVVHQPAEWTGSPVSGWYAGGCPDETDRMNRDGQFGGPDGTTMTERDRIAATAATYAAAHPVSEARVPREHRPHYGYTSSGRSRCEDAPCCGCCD